MKRIKRKGYTKTKQIKFNSSDKKMFLIQYRR